MDKCEVGVSKNEVEKRNKLSAQQKVNRLQTHTFY
jgi:hypothetical protein